MSRHDIPGKHPDLLATVGWDRPLQTFFAQVGRPGSDSDDLVLWLGTSHRACPRPEDMAAALAPYADLKPAIIERLNEDRRAERGPTAPLPEPRREPEVLRGTPRR